LFPAACFRCSHSAPEHGPYLDTAHVDTYMDRVVYYCARCAEALIRPLEVVPLARLKEAQGQAQIAEEHIHEISRQPELIQALEKEIEAYRDRLAMACSERDANKRAVVEIMNRAKVERREALFASVGAKNGEGPPAPATTRKAKPRGKP
jgi:hypothetical protein